MLDPNARAGRISSIERATFLCFISGTRKVRNSFRLIKKHSGYGMELYK